MSNNVPDNWYENFFSGINCEMWEKAASEDWTEEEVSFLMDVMKVRRGASILDIPCGTGRHAVKLAKKGFNITCFDISDEFITGLGQKVKDENLSIQIIHGNILTSELTGSFDGAFCLGNSFGYFDYEGMKVFIQKVAACLRPASRFIINSGMVAESILPRIPPEKTYDLGDLTMQVNNEYVVSDSYMISHLKYTKSNHSEEHSFKHYVYSIGEIRRLLALYGIHILALYSAVDKTIYKLGEAQVYIIAEKT
ncbi:MAG: class I SAM-dependent methyltransferase [Chitinophagaceae bacterium]